MRPRRIGRTLEGISVAVDGYDWVDIKFENCEIILATGDLSMVDCSFNNCRLTVQGRAEAVARIVALFMKGQPIKFLNKDTGP